MQKHAPVPINTFFCLILGRPTLDLNLDTAERLISFFVPRMFIQRTTFCKTWRSVARQFQLIPSSRHRDHLPLVAEVMVGFERFGAPVSARWDYDALASAAQFGAGREPFLVALSERVTAAEGKLGELGEENTLDGHWEALVSNVREVGRRFFSQGHQTRTRVEGGLRCGRCAARC